MRAGDGLVPWACDACLRRAWLVESLASMIEKIATSGERTRAQALMALDDEMLIRAVAPKRAAELIAGASSIDPIACRALIEAARCWACCRHDPRFPVGLDRVPEAPHVLICRGNPGLLDSLTPTGSVTVVGARRATPYGTEVAGQLARELTSAGMLVVSGMARGIDSAAHRGALERGPTVAVLGTGPDVPYPANSARLHRQICAEGLVISERPPGATAWRWCFPARNRIMAALADLTVVVEADRRSGSLITAGMAQELGRDVGAVPGPVTHTASTGTNQLLVDGAIPIRDATDVLEAILGPGASPRPRPGPSMGAEEARVLAEVEAGRVTPDAIASAAGLEPATTAAAISSLEQAGYVSLGLDGCLFRTALAGPDAG